MKIAIFIIITTFAVVFISSCEKDNYSPPSLKFTAPLTYNGDTLFVNDITLEFWQKGYQGNIPISTTIDNWGVFHNLFFSGTYYVVPKKIKYPFVWNDFTQQPDGSFDTLKLEMGGDISRSFSITPYYKISNFTAALVNDTIVTAEYDVDTVLVNPAVTIKNINVYYQTSILVNQNTPAKPKALPIKKHMKYSIDLLDYKKKYVNNYRTYIFLRVGIETIVPQYKIWSDVIRVDLPDQWWLKIKRQ